MRKNAQAVISAFLAGKKKNEKTIHTDGHALYSYAMPIAFRDGEVVYVVYYADAPTATTRSHVRAISQSVPKNNLVEMGADEIRFSVEKAR